MQSARVTTAPTCLTPLPPNRLSTPAGKRNFPRLCFQYLPRFEGPSKTGEHRRTPENSWVEAFEWIRSHTPQDAYFALDPDSTRLPGEDDHGFRAISQRSMVADNWTDSGVVSMFPALARVERTSGGIAPLGAVPTGGF